MIKHMVRVPKLPPAANLPAAAQDSAGFEAYLGRPALAVHTPALHCAGRMGHSARTAARLSSSIPLVRGWNLQAFDWGRMGDATTIVSPAGCPT